MVPNVDWATLAALCLRPGVSLSNETAHRLPPTDDLPTNGTFAPIGPKARGAHISGESNQISNKHSGAIVPPVGSIDMANVLSTSHLIIDSQRSPCVNMVGWYLLHLLTDSLVLRLT